jgi:L-threonylcarbamoyladenylate synthase
MRRVAIGLSDPRSEVIEEAVDILLNGGVIAYPTDTLYGLGCDATNPRAVERLCAIKRRPEGQPLPVIVNRRAALKHLVEGLTPQIERVLARHWPGALTVVFRRRGDALSAVAPGPTLGLRIPDAPVALALARGLCRPIVATSANRSGEPPLGPDEIESLLSAEIDLLLDAGPAPGSIASTVLDVSGTKPTILREGAIPVCILARDLPELNA